MIAFAREPLYGVSSEVDGLLREHYLELAKNQDRVKLNVDWDRYAAMEQAGGLLIYTARSAGELIGYSAFFSSPHPHYLALRLVSNDVLFLDKAHRVGRTGVRFIRFCEEQVRALYQGEVALTWHAKEHTPLAGMLGRMGYQVQDIVLSRLL